MTLAWIFTLSLLGSVGAVGGAGVLLLFPETTRKVLVPALVSYATGSLLAAALIGLIPEAVDQMGAKPGGDSLGRVLAVVLAGILAFFVLEKIVLWRHCHEGECDVHRAAGVLILVGDSFHNLVDGIVLAAAFLHSEALGMTAALAVIVHEITQEVGDFAILLESGYSRRKAFIYNLLSSLATLVGAIGGYYALSALRSTIPYFLAISAASFLYVALSDLVPGLHRRVATAAASLVQFLLVLAGIGSILLVRLLHS
ncbi:MAG: ZIP family metal transporter [Planctomycetes bacterium]|nr:ZIP family metal transporter [Planctomycetota bacterium]